MPSILICFDSTRKALNLVELQPLLVWKIIFDQNALLVVMKINILWIWWYRIFLCLDIGNCSLGVASNNNVIIISCIRSKYFFGTDIAGFHVRMTISLQSQNILALTWLRISWSLIYPDRWCFKRNMLRFYYISYYWVGWFATPLRLCVDFDFFFPASFFFPLFTIFDTTPELPLQFIL